MERIKQAIANAKVPRPDEYETFEAVHRQRTGQPVGIAEYSIRINWSAIKYLMAAIIIFLGGWVWLRLDFMNQIEVLTSQFINDGLQQSRAEIRRQAEAEEKFQQAIQASLAHCMAMAEKDKEDYLSLMKQEMHKKVRQANPSLKEPVHMSRTTLDEASAMEAEAKAACQKVYQVQQEKHR